LVLCVAFGAAQALRGDAPIRLATLQRQEAMREEVRRHMTDKAFGAALGEGTAMSLEEALACALADQQDAASRDAIA
jgi:hypothetical protein